MTAFLIGSGSVTAGTELGMTEVFQNHGGVWMSTEVGSDGEMTPRKRIGGVGYAFKACEAESALTAKNLTHIEPRSAAPPDPVEGDVYMSSTTHRLYIYDGSLWQACW